MVLVFMFFIYYSHLSNLIDNFYELVTVFVETVDVSVGRCCLYARY